MKVIKTVKVPMYVMAEDVFSALEDPGEMTARCEWYLGVCREIIKTMTIAVVTLLLVWFAA